MGRRVPDENVLLIHPILCFSFFAIGLAASIAIITSMCSVVSFRRKNPKQSSSPTESEPLEIISNSLDASSPPPNTSAIEKSSETENNETKELPLPPAMQMPAKESLPSTDNFKRGISERRASFRLSMKVPRTLSVAKNRNWEKLKEEKGNIKGKLKAEDNVWMKTIILGEKCVPAEEDNPVIYEGKGKRIAAYHPKNSASVLSRQCSFLDNNPLSISQPQTKEEIANDT